MAHRIRLSRLIQLLEINPDITLDELAARLALPARIVQSDIRSLR